MTPTNGATAGAWNTDGCNEIQVAGFDADHTARWDDHDDDEPPFDPDADPWLIVAEYSPHPQPVIDSVRGLLESPDVSIEGLSLDAVKTIAVEIPLSLAVVLPDDHLIFQCREELQRRAVEAELIDDHKARLKAQQALDKEHREKIAAEAAAEAEAAASSWDPIDVSDILDEIEAGTLTLPEPTIMPRADGLCLMYPGLVHSFHGESESGKSLLMQYAAAVELAERHDVLYLDYESDQRSVVQRVAQLGAPLDAIRRHFRYVRPSESLSTAASRLHWARLLEAKYSLAILDGVTDALATFGYSSVDNDDVTAWQRDMPKAIADATGAAVALIDHVSKDNTGRGRFAVGGSAKMNGLTGAAYIVEVEQPLGRGRRGALTVRIGKDRPGGVRGRLPAAEKMRTDRTEVVATVVVDSSKGDEMIYVDVQVPTLVTEGIRDRPTKIMERVSKYVEGCGLGGALRANVKRDVDGKADQIVKAIGVLIEEKYLAGDARKPLTSVTPYREAADLIAQPTAL